MEKSCSPAPVEAAEQDQARTETRPKWSALLTFTSVSSNLLLAVAIALSIVSGIVIPALSIFLGKLFDAFTSFGANDLDGPGLVHQVSRYGLGLVILGGISGAFNAAFFASWLVFGELRAKRAREQSFKAMLSKDMAWFDTRETGIAALASRIQTFVQPPVMKLSSNGVSSESFESFRWLFHSHWALQYNTSSQCWLPSALPSTTPGI